MRSFVYTLIILGAPLLGADNLDERAREAVEALGSTLPLAINRAAPVAVPQPPDKDPAGPQVRLIAMKTDIARRYSYLVPAIPVAPFTQWRRWLREQGDAVHCVLEWRTNSGEWYFAELRSTHSTSKNDRTRVGRGEFPGTGYDAYGIYISRGRVSRTHDDHGRPVEVTLDEPIDCDYHKLEAAVRKYGAISNDRDAGVGNGRENSGRGGPAFKPSQNCNTMVNFVLRACGVQRKAPERAVGWDTVPHFPYSSDRDTFKYDNQP